MSFHVRQCNGFLLIFLGKRQQILTETFHEGKLNLLGCPSLAKTVKFVYILRKLYGVFTIDVPVTVTVRHLFHPHAPVAIK